MFTFVRPASIRLYALLSKVLATSLLVLPSLSLAASCPDLPGDPSSWKEQERWVWKNICSGSAADLRTFGGSYDPGGAKDWPPKRELSQRFIETILLSDPYRSSIPRQGVTIIGARFFETVDLSHAKLDHDLWLTYSSFEGTSADESLNLVGAEIAGHLNLSASTASKRVNMDSLHAGALSMAGGPAPGNQWIRSRWDSIWLATARINGQLDVSDSTVAGDLTLSEIVVATDLKLIKSTLTKVILRFAKIGGTLEIEGPKTRTEPRPKNHAQSVDLTGAQVKMLLLGSDFYGPINAPENWGSGAYIVLTGASVQGLQDGLCGDAKSDCRFDTWPEVKLTGFEPGLDLLARPAEWWAGWLNKQRPYSPQLYEYFAAALFKLSYKDTATSVLYAGKNRELKEATHFPDNIGLWLERVFIGYGYRIYYSLFWVVGFIIFGAAMMRLSGQGPANRMPYGLAFSFDMLLPVVKLREYHYSIDLKGWVRYYFYFHKLMGYLLASFLIAGLSGLTK